MRLALNASTLGWSNTLAGSEFRSGTFRKKVITASEMTYYYPKDKMV